MCKGHFVIIKLFKGKLVHHNWSNVYECKRLTFDSKNKQKEEEKIYLILIII